MGPALYQNTTMSAARPPFWMYCREDLRKLKRITLLWDYIRAQTELNPPFLLGEAQLLRKVD